MTDASAESDGAPAVSRQSPVLKAVPLVAVGAILLGAGTELLPPDDIFKITLSRVLIVAGLACIVVLYGLRAELFKTGLEIPIAALLVAAVAATAHSHWNYPLLRFLIESVALFYLTVALVRTDSNALAALAFVALVTVTASASEGVAQFAQGEQTGFYREGFTPVTALGPPPPGTVTRAIGSFANPNLLATHILLLTPLAAVAAATARVWELRIVMWGLVGLAGLGLILTFSRAGIGAALIAGAVVAFTAHRSWRRHILIGAGAAAVAIGIGVLASGGELVNGFGRPLAWSTAFDVIGDNPVFGVGLGRAADVMNVVHPGLTFRHAHNLWLTWWVDAGSLAFVAWVWITVWLVLHGYRLVARRVEQSVYASAALMGLLGFFAFSFLDHPANVARIATTFWIVAAIVAAQRTGSARANVGEAR